MLPLFPLLPHKLIRNIQIPIKIQTSRFVVEVGAVLAFVKQLQRLHWLNIQPLGHYATFNIAKIQDYPEKIVVI